MVNFLIHCHFISLPISVYLLWGLFSSAFATLFFVIISYCHRLLHIVAYCYILLNSVILLHILLHIVTYCYIYSYKTKTFVSFLIWFCTYSSIRLNSFSNTLVNPSNQTRLFHDEILETNGVLIFLFTNFDRPNNHQSDKTHLFILSQLLCLHFQGIVLMQHLPMIESSFKQS